ncbi:protein disulfide isomerase-like 1-3 [Mercurialis annua]|uniref:protein disulfide isomerase-like 1-3 n=1 Tax=Mercurialis annua TaxID=3986 RepID=UPI00215EBB76|nr:protein disulfide isomerase-like 1-3 [Mercurialis annua]
MKKPELLLLIPLIISIFLTFTHISITFIYIFPQSPPHPNFISSFFNDNTLITEDSFAESISEESEDSEDQNNYLRNEFQAAYQDDVVVLTQNNFSDFVAENKYVMVDFYASWCYFSQQLAPQYGLAATMLKGNNSEAVLAKVDCVEEPELARKFNIQGYPTMYFLVDGGAQQIVYDSMDERTRDALVHWVNKKVNVAVKNLTAMEEAEVSIKLNSVMVLGFLDSLEGPESKELDAVSKMHLDVDFYQTTNINVANLFHIEEQIKRPALVLVKPKPPNNTHFIYEGEFTKVAVADFVSLYKIPSVITFKSEAASSIFENPMKQLWLFTSDGSCDALSIFKEAADIFKGKLLFVHVETSTEVYVGRNLAYEFGVTGDTPRIVARYSTIDGTEKHMYRGELSSSGIKSFAEELLEVEGKFVTEPVLRLPSDHFHSFVPTSLPQIY